jgi:thiamine biosynthesis lipoprotein
MHETEKAEESRVHRFSHAAMATSFECLIADQDQEYARQAAAEVFRLVDRIETDLSRFRESSDVSAINRLAPGESIRVGVHAFACLTTARAVYDATSGAFDVTAGALMACWRDHEGNAKTPTEVEIEAARSRVGMDGLHLDETAMTVRVTRHVQVDLGGIGKGYALDQAAELLREWDVTTALLNAGESTVLAMGAPQGAAGWPVGIGGSRAGQRTSEALMLRDRALSGSGGDVKGSHIMNPRTGHPADGTVAAWSVCASAATADALSTAFMVMTPSEVEKYCAAHPDTAALLLVREGDSTKAIRFGL